MEDAVPAALRRPPDVPPGTTLQVGGPGSTQLSLASIVERSRSIASSTLALEALDLFLTNGDLRVIPVVDRRRPVGLVSRQILVETFSRPFRRDLFGRRTVSDFMDPNPIVVGIDTDIDELAQRLVTAGLQQMLDGFLVVDAAQRYAGIGNVQALLNEVTKRQQEHLHRLAHYDALTGLPNRVLFRDRLAMALGQARRNGSQVALAFIDIDHFKRINDALGHPAGDELLQVVARRLQGVLRGPDTLARMGGDEFTLVLTDLDGPADAVHALRRLRERLTDPIPLEGHATVVTASIGVALYPDDALEIDELVRKADIALYASKRAGRDTASFFDATHGAFDGDSLSMEHDLRLALQQGEIKPVYQAVFEAASGRLVGAEALARWHHLERGPVAPATFVPLAEDCGLIGRLDQAVLRQAGAAVAAMPGMSGKRLSVNTSAIEIRSPEFVEELLATAAEAGVALDRLQLEITERLFLEPRKEILDRLQGLRDLGIRIAIDDFGIGSTSLRVLHRLPVDVLKIDRSFISGFCEDPRIDALVRAVIDMGHALELEIVAEGVETDEQAERLRSYGCDLLQGYLLGRPLPAAEFEAWLAAGCITPPGS
ncbi:EAL domain-containing protein [Thioalkalivibrio sp. XN8]|nr:EAL domain-containing protein [Thioalkalivibrio sp. XN8]